MKDAECESKFGDFLSFSFVELMEHRVIDKLLLLVLIY